MIASFTAFSILGETVKPSTKRATAVLAAALLSAVVFSSDMAGTANAAPRGNVVPADYTCPAASATAPACFYNSKNFNGDVEPPFYPNTGYQHRTDVYGVRNRNTVYYLCLKDEDSGLVRSIPPKGEDDQVGPEGFYLYEEVYFHSTTC